MSKEVTSQKPPPKNQNNKIISIIKDFIPWLFPTSIFLGGFFAYSYFSFIGKINFLPEIIGQTSVFISTFIVLLIFGFFISIPFLVPFWLTITIRINNFYINKEDSKTRSIKNHFNFVAISMYFPIISLMLFILFFILKYDETAWGSYVKSSLTILLHLSSFILFSIVYYLKNKKVEKTYDGYKFKNKFSIKNYSETIQPLILHSVYSIPILFLTSSTWFSHEKNSLYITLIPFVFLILNIFIANIILFKEKSERNNTRNMHFFLIIPLLISFLCLMVLFLLSENLPRSMFSKIHLVEMPKNSQWYIINYKNSIIPEIHLKKAKEKFICTPSKSFSCKEFPNTHPDFFFGYMAWNLGEKKIFCPYSAQFGSDKTANQVFSKTCIIINSNAITPWDEQYIHSPYPLKAGYRISV